MRTFVEFAQEHGVDIDPSRLHPSDRIHRCGTREKPRSDNGAYYWDGQRGWVMNWSQDSKVNWYQDPNAKPWIESEKAEWRASRAASATAQQNRYRNAAQEAEKKIKHATMAEHNYLHYKGFPEEKGLVFEENLLIPMRNVRTGQVQGYQSIKWNSETRKYDKKMKGGMMARNAVFWLGARTANEVWLVEGYATGLSVRNALRSCGMPASVLVAFSAANLVKVAEQVQGDRFVFADNDVSGIGQKAAEKTGLPWTMSDEPGEDANDLHKRAGLFAVVAKIMECRMRNA